MTRLVYEDRVEVPRLYVQWPTVGERNDDRFALDVLASILSGPRTARLTKALVFDQQAAASVVAQQSTNEDVGEFGLAITPRPGHSLTDLESAADSVIATFKAEGATAEEIQKATAGEELGFLDRPAVEPREIVPPDRRRGLPRRRWLLPHGVPEASGRDRRRREAGGRQVL